MSIEIRDLPSVRSRNRILVLRFGRDRPRGRIVFRSNAKGRDFRDELIDEGIVDRPARAGARPRRTIGRCSR